MYSYIYKDLIMWLTTQIDHEHDKVVDADQQNLSHGNGCCSHVSGSSAPKSHVTGFHVVITKKQNRRKRRLEREKTKLA